MRMAMSVGLEAFRRVDWDLARLICDASGVAPAANYTESLRVAEDAPTKYKAGKK